MGKLVSNFFISLDGVVEAPDEWHFAYFDDEMGQAVGAGTQSCGAFLMGREMYDQWSDYWPAQGDDDFGGFINHIRKYVVSSTLQDPAWTNTSVVPGDADAIRALKAEVDGDIGMSGSTTTVRWLLSEGLVDELHLLVHPIAVGKGERLFPEGSTYALRLVSSKTFGSGVLHLVYAPA